MFASLLYKEYREHRSIWLAMALVGVGVLVGVPLCFRPEASDREFFIEFLGASAIIISWAYGIVCGGMLLAGECEEGTQVFLDVLPSTRQQLWFGKVLAGAVFVLLQIVVLAGVAEVQAFAPSRKPIEGVVVLAFCGILGFGWGILFSAVSSNVLRAIGLAILVQLLAGPLLFGAVMIGLAILALPFGGGETDGVVSEFLAFAFLLVVPFFLSALLYSRADRGRRRMLAPNGVKRVSWWSSWSQLIWLSWRQTRGMLIGLAIFSVLAGFPVISKGLFIWPIITLLIGAFCGATIFLDEQGGAYRFLGEQRFPLGRIWLIKAAVRLAVVALCTLLAFIPALFEGIVWGVRKLNRDHDPILGSALLGETIPIGLFLILWPIFGFCVGTVAGMLFRKALVGLVVAVGLAVALVSVWVPSLTMGGLYLWQVIGVPVVLLACSRLLMRVWASDRIVSGPTARLLAVTTLSCAALTALGLWYRVVEFPDTPEPDDFTAFVTGFPTPEENEAGRLIRTACARLEEVSKKWAREPARKRVNPRAVPGQGFNESYLSLCRTVVANGWPKRDDELAEWLDDAFKEVWWRPLEEARGKPTGVVEDARRLTVLTRLPALEQAQSMGFLLPAHGLQIQKTKGDPAVFVDHLAVALSLVRNVQNRAPWVPAAVAQQIEASQIEALTRWLEALDGRPELLARAAATIRLHRQSHPPDDHDILLAEYLISLNTLDDPGAWLVGGQLSGHEQDDLSVLALGWNVPWESTRRLRLLRTLFWDGNFDWRQVPYTSLRTVPAFAPRRQSREHHSRRLVQLGVAELMIALRRFQAETGRPAERLDQLVPRYLSRLPLDPFDSAPIRYRLSQGEEILGRFGNSVPGGAGQPDDMAAGGPAAAGGAPGGFGPPPAEKGRNVPAGQGILWSVGEDGKDDGGRRQGRWNGNSRTSPGEDLIYLVPLPAGNAGKGDK
jgi:hypothetical protein